MQTLDFSNPIDPSMSLSDQELLARARFYFSPTDLKRLTSLLAHTLPSRAAQPSQAAIDAMFEVVADAYHIDNIGAIAHIEARRALATLLRQNQFGVMLSYEEIGRLLSPERPYNHSTIIWYVETFQPDDRYWEAIRLFRNRMEAYHADIR